MLHQQESERPSEGQPENTAEYSGCAGSLKIRRAAAAASPAGAEQEARIAQLVPPWRRKISSSKPSRPPGSWPRRMRPRGRPSPGPARRRSRSRGKRAESRPCARLWTGQPAPRGGRGFEAALPGDGAGREVNLARRPAREEAEGTGMPTRAMPCGSIPGGEAGRLKNRWTRESSCKPSAPGARCSRAPAGLRGIFQGRAPGDAGGQGRPGGDLRPRVRPIRTGMTIPWPLRPPWAAMQNIVVGSEADGKAAIRYLKRCDGGRATFLPRSTVRGGSSGSGA